MIHGHKLIKRMESRERPKTANQGRISFFLTSREFSKHDRKSILVLLHGPSKFAEIFNGNLCEQNFQLTPKLYMNSHCAYSQMRYLDTRLSLDMLKLRDPEDKSVLSLVEQSRRFIFIELVLYAYTANKHGKKSCTEQNLAAKKF